jgi:hypothetical protein
MAVEVESSPCPPWTFTVVSLVTLPRYVVLSFVAYQLLYTSRFNSIQFIRGDVLSSVLTFATANNEQMRYFAFVYRCGIETALKYPKRVITAY